MSTSGSPAGTNDRNGRASRISLRVSSEQAELLKRAVKAQVRTSTDFVLSSATVAAEHALADRRLFRLSADAWDAFETALERPAVFKPRLGETMCDENFFVS